jgi:hypothetical protein
MTSRVKKVARTRFAKPAIEAEIISLARALHEHAGASFQKSIRVLNMLCCSTSSERQETHAFRSLTLGEMRDTVFLDAAEPPIVRSYNPSPFEQLLYPTRAEKEEV